MKGIAQQLKYELSVRIPYRISRLYIRNQRVFLTLMFSYRFEKPLKVIPNGNLADYWTETEFDDTISDKVDPFSQQDRIEKLQLRTSSVVKNTGYGRSPY